MQSFYGCLPFWHAARYQNLSRFGCDLSKVNENKSYVLSLQSLQSVVWVTLMAEIRLSCGFSHGWEVGNFGLRLD